MAEWHDFDAEHESSGLVAKIWEFAEIDTLQHLPLADLVNLYEWSYPLKDWRAAGKVRELTARVYEFSVLAVNNRIQAEILRLARRAACEGGRARIEVPPTHVEIASRTSTHREAVTRELNRLARLGLIKREGKALIVEDILRLEMMVHRATGE